MGILQRSAVTIGFYGDDLDPTHITASLGAVPTVGVRKGGLWLTSMGAEKIARSGSWRLRAECHEAADLDRQINDVLNRLSDDLSAWRLFAAQFRGRVFCGLFLASGNEGLTLRPSTLIRVGERGLVVDLDIYGQDLPN